MKRLLSVTIVMAVMASLLMGCGSTEQTASAGKAESMSEEEQDALIFMGGLYADNDPGNDMELAVFRRKDGALIYVIHESGNYEYGVYATESAKTDDGRDYEKIIVNDGKSYGYYFNDDLTTGIVIGEDGKVCDAVELDESAARELLSTAIAGG